MSGVLTLEKDQNRVPVSLYDLSKTVESIVNTFENYFLKGIKPQGAHSQFFMMGGRGGSDRVSYFIPKKKICSKSAIHVKSSVQKWLK